MILVIVSHPDDEAIWFGASICGLVNDLNQQVVVLCLSGHDPNSLREVEFKKSQGVAGFQFGKVLGGPLAQANHRLPPAQVTVDTGLKALNISLSQIEIVVTHSPYGDEHRHPHHAQCFRSIEKWCKVNKKPLTFFSTIPIPAGAMRPVLRGLKRSNFFHITNISRCDFSFFEKLKYYNASGSRRLPKYYVQFVGQADKKLEMLRCYQSVDQDQFRSGYGMYSCNAESLYVLDYEGFDKLMSILEFAYCPATEQLFGQIRFSIVALKNHIKIRFKRAFAH